MTTRSPSRVSNRAWASCSSSRSATFRIASSCCNTSSRCPSKTKRRPSTGMRPTLQAPCCLLRALALPTRNRSCSWSGTRSRHRCRRFRKRNPGSTLYETKRKYSWGGRSPRRPPGGEALTPSSRRQTRGSTTSRGSWRPLDAPCYSTSGKNSETGSTTAS